MKPLLSICLPSYRNFEETWFTINSLRLYQDLKGVEIVVLDSYGDDHLKSHIEYWCRANKPVKYLCNKTLQDGPAAAKEAAIQACSGEWFLCMDSHVLLVPNAIRDFKKWIHLNRESNDLVQSCLLHDDLRTVAPYMDPVWSGQFFGTWHTMDIDLVPDEAEICFNGMGLFAGRKDAWVGFNPKCKGFGGVEEFIVQEHYRRRGDKVICLKCLAWNHLFRPQNTAPPYAMNLEDRKRNYILNFTELGMPLRGIEQEFGDICL